METSVKTGTLGILLTLLAVPNWATAPKEADYPISYEVVTNNRFSSWVGNICTMALRDQATKVTYIVQIDAVRCRVWDKDSGTVIRGSRKKNKIDLLMQTGKGSPKVERWTIVGSQ